MLYRWAWDCIRDTKNGRVTSGLAGQNGFWEIDNLETKIFREPRNILGGTVVYTDKTTRGVGD